jgi:C-terminal processing protease CtpA/Prc
MDHIVRIDSSPTDALTLVECIQRLRGEPGSTVSVWVKRGEQQIQVNITRETVVR